jgi:hypothetical protein
MVHEEIIYLIIIIINIYGAISYFVTVYIKIYILIL